MYSVEMFKDSAGDGIYWMSADFPELWVTIAVDFLKSTLLDYF